jgi:hypothetical protein
VGVHSVLEKHARQMLTSDDVGGVLKHQLADSFRMQRRQRRKGVHDILHTQHMLALQHHGANEDNIVSSRRASTVSAAPPMTHEDLESLSAAVEDAIGSTELSELRHNKYAVNYHFNPLTKKYQLGMTWRNIIEEAVYNQIGKHREMEARLEEMKERELREQQQAASSTATTPLTTMALPQAPTQSTLMPHRPMSTPTHRNSKFFGGSTQRPGTVGMPQPPASSSGRRALPSMRRKRVSIDDSDDEDDDTTNA